jgi:hypothetical protein
VSTSSAIASWPLSVHQPAIIEPIEALHHSQLALDASGEDIREAAVVVRRDRVAQLVERVRCGGGALVIEDTYGERPIKPSSGELILYPSTSLHWVDPVTSGVRLAAVGAQLRARTGAPRDPVRSGDGASGRYMPNKVSRANRYAGQKTHESPTTVG